VTFSISYRQTVSKFQDQDVTLSMVGNATLGPLHEKSATLGESTQSPTTLFAGDIFTTGELSVSENEKHPEQSFSGLPSNLIRWY